MSAQTNKVKTQGTAKKSRKSKRKAKSPLLVESGQTGSGTGGVSDFYSVNKRLTMNDRSFADSSINTSNTMSNMNFNQNMTSPSPQFPHYAYNMQMPQMLQSQPLYQSTPMASAGQSAPPPWAIQIMDDMKVLKESIPKIDKIERTVSNISLKINEIETKIKQMETLTLRNPVNS